MVMLSLSVVLLALAGQTREAEVGLGECVGDGRVLEVKVGVELAPVCVGAGGSTVLEFESAIVGERNAVEGGDVEPFTGVGGKKLMVVGAAGAALGVARRITVYFGDGFEPVSATFPLVVVADSTKRVVTVMRQPRTAASLREEVEDLTRRLEACTGAGRESPTVSAPAGLLAGLLALSRKDGGGLRWVAANDFAVAPGFEGSVRRVGTLLFRGDDGAAEAAVRVSLANEASATWAVEEASLVSSSGEALARVRIRTPVVVEANGFGDVDVVSEPTRRAVPGRYTLKLRGQGRELVLENVTFKPSSR